METKRRNMKEEKNIYTSKKKEKGITSVSEGRLKKEGGGGIQKKKRRKK